LCSVSLYHGLRNIINDVSGSTKVLSVMTRLRQGVLIFALVWFAGRSSVLALITPCVWTLLGHLLLRSARQWLRGHRRWSHHISPLLPRWLVGWLQSKAWVSQIMSIAAYGGLTLIWFPYVEQWVGERHWAILQSLRLFMFSGLFNSVIIVFFSLILIKMGDRVLRYYVEEKYSADTVENNFLASRLKTLMAMLSTLLRVVVWIPAVGLIFSQFGNVNLSTWVTSIGAASFGLTFGLQHIVRDFIAGFFIILENNLMVGDEVEVDQRSGKVEAITIRTLKIRSDQGMLLTIPFGSIQVIGNKNRQFSAIVLNISVGYNESIEKVQSLVEKTFALVKRTPLFGRRIIGPLEFRGITEVTSFSMIFQVKITTAPNMQDSIRRAFTRQLKIAFDEAGVVVPVPPVSTARAIPSLTNTILS
jgi:small conductance mechanosensitive channel